MSSVRYFNGTPHIVRYGMQDEKNAKCWVLFWRNGVKFEISVHRSDVTGTRFEKKWMELNKEPGLGKRPLNDWVHRWDMLCDCVISQCLDLLEKLAPDGTEYWITLKDYLHTPGYKLKIVADEGFGDAIGQYVNRLHVDGAYEMAPLPTAEVNESFTGVPQYLSEDLRVIDREVNWRTPPHRVQTAQAECFAFKHIDRYSRWVDKDEIVNHALDIVRMHLRVRQHCDAQPGGYPDRIPQVLGYVTDESIPGEDRVEDKTRAMIPGIDTKGEHKDLIAGILLSDFPHFRALGDLVREAKTDYVLLASIKENQETWKSQTLTIIKDVHARGMACGCSSLYENLLINSWSIHIDNELMVWLDPSIEHFMSVDNDSVSIVSGDNASDDERTDFEVAKAQDLKAMKKVFEEWLPAALAKIEDAAEANNDKA